MIKQCVKCHQKFECRVKQIEQCHCSSVKLTTEQQQVLSTKYNDCLCPTCLQALQAEPQVKKEKD